ncbi:cation:proton antiporter [Corynebacterium sp. sy017]|uniref:cation:proton antiporter n=1 Tax=unclassified Corynebacterium TaxID=2624378 RepID=UPI001185E3DC|nr:MULTISPECIES: cation:proton antiporter [unclassified Corynebacterium]MBP3088151.1 cation:proton antiporter [Corynebacterium sp. sy017]TSD92774.1 cation:proton antiporter [Corynebacterium sp. SY003]
MLSASANTAETGTHALVSFAWIMAAALAAPILSWATRKHIPAVVFLLVLGVIIGPHVLGLARNDSSIDMLKELGLGLLFLLAGFEIDLDTMKDKAGKSALITWVVCMVFSFFGALLVVGADDTSAAIVLAIALTSTALGTLMPILKQQGWLATPIGRRVMIHGAIGELAPIMAMALLLSTRSTFLTAIVLALFFLIALFVAFLPRTVRFFAPWVRRAMIDGASATNQTVVRAVLLMLAILMSAAAVFQLDVVLGAFAAGIILKQLVPENLRSALEERLDVLGYGLLIPVFFVVSGMGIDIGAVAQAPFAPIILVAVILLTRGVPIMIQELFFAKDTQLETWQDKVQVGFYSATGLPIIVAVTEVATHSHIIRAQYGSLLVAAGAATVLVFPLLAAAVGRAAVHKKPSREKQRADKHEQEKSM